MTAKRTVLHELKIGTLIFRVVIQQRHKVDQTCLADLECQLQKEGKTRSGLLNRNSHHSSSENGQQFRKVPQVDEGVFSIDEP